MSEDTAAAAATTATEEQDGGNNNGNSSDDSGAYLVVRIRGQADVPYWAVHTMSLLKLERKYRATILPAKENTLGMLSKIKHYVAWTRLDAELAQEIIEKKARKSGYRRITQEDIKGLGFDGTKQMAESLSRGSSALSKLKPLKPWFALAPPKHGFRRSTKRLAGQKGVLGNNDELGEIVRRMMAVAE
ncbi:MAG: 50S ribosomal protein L30 [Nitrosopumilaceae archaeon]|nr:50S ribosomal protein L30 [Nitrosopumilaceae archaeon]